MSWNSLDLFINQCISFNLLRISQVTLAEELEFTHREAHVGSYHCIKGEFWRMCQNLRPFTSHTHIHRHTHIHAPPLTPTVTTNCWCIAAVEHKKHAFKSGRSDLFRCWCKRDKRNRARRYTEKCMETRWRNRKYASARCNLSRISCLSPKIDHFIWITTKFHGLVHQKSLFLMVKLEKLGQDELKFL